MNYKFLSHIDDQQEEELLEIEPNVPTNSKFVKSISKILGWKHYGFSLAIISMFLCIGVIFFSTNSINVPMKSLTRKAKQETEDYINGQYFLVSFSSNYPDYLKAWGVSSSYVKTVVSESEYVNITKNDTHIKYALSFKNLAINKVFEHEFGKDTIKNEVHSICLNPEKNVIKCEHYFEDKRGRIGNKNETTTSEYSKDGFVSHKNHLTGNIEIKKFYQRIPKFIGQSINNTFGKTGDVILVVDPSIHTTESDVMVFDDGFDDDFLDDE